MKFRQERSHIRKRTNRLAVAVMTLFGLAVVGGIAVAAPNARVVEAQTAVQTRLADAKLKACQNREKAINNIMARIADRGSKQLDVFNKIAQRTETFYTTKGKTLSNYDALVADVNTKRVAAQTAVDAVKVNSVTFKCDSTDPKGAAQLFKDGIKARTVALKNYKTAVKNLIVSVKSVQGTTTSTDNKTTGGQQ